MAQLMLKYSYSETDPLSEYLHIFLGLRIPKLNLWTSPCPGIKGTLATTTVMETLYRVPQGETIPASVSETDTYKYYTEEILDVSAYKVFGVKSSSVLHPMQRFTSINEGCRI